MDKKLSRLLNQQKLSILIGKIDHIGDTLLYTPALASLKKSYPHSEITVLVSEFTQDVIKGNSCVDKILVYPKSEEELKVFYKEIKESRFHIILNFSAAVKDFLEINKMGGRYRISPVYKKMAVSRFTAVFTLDKSIICDDDPGEYERNPNLQLLHEVEQNEKVVMCLGAESVDSPLILPVFDEDHLYAETLFDNKINLNNEQETIAIQISDRWFWEGWIEKGITGLIQAVRRRFPRRNLICFSYAGIKELTDRIIINTAEAESCNDTDKSINTDSHMETKEACLSPTPQFVSSSQGGSLFSIPSASIHFISNLPLKKYAALLKRCKLLITMHSGATHISAAAGTPSVVVFNSEYFGYYSKRESPWKTPFQAVKKEWDVKGFNMLTHTQKEETVSKSIDTIIEAAEEMLEKKNKP